MLFALHIFIVVLLYYDYTVFRRTGNWLVVSRDRNPLVVVDYITQTARSIPCSIARVFSAATRTTTTTTAQSSRPSPPLRPSRRSRRRIEHFVRINEPINKSTYLESSSWCAGN